MRKRLLVLIAGPVLVATTMSGTSSASVASTKASSTAGTIFFSRSNPKSGSLHNLSIRPSGKHQHKLPGDGNPIYPAPGAKLTVTTVEPAAPKQHEIRTATYAGKTLATYRPGADFISVLSVSPNGKFLGIESFDGKKIDYDITKIDGTVVSTVLVLPPKKQDDQIEESWSGTSKQLAVAVLTDAGTSSITTYDRHARKVRRVVKNVGSIVSVAWSSTGTIAYAASHSIWTVSAKGGTPTLLLKSTADFPGIGLSFSPHGASLVFGYASGSTGATQIWVVKVAHTADAHAISTNGFGPTWG